MGAVNALLDATGRLYAAALDPAEWSSALDAMLSVVGGGHAILVAQGHDATPLVASARLAEHHRALFFAPDAAPLFAPFQFAMAPGAAVLRQQIIGDSEFERSALYNEVVRPADGFHGIHALHSGFGGFSLAVCRGRQRGMFGEAEVATIQALAPHVAMVIEFRRRLRGADQVNANLTRLLDMVEQGVVLTDTWSRPSFANWRGEAILAAGDGLRLASDGIAGANPAATRELRDAIAAISLDQATTPRRLRLPRPGRPPLLVSVTPMWRLGATVHGVPASAAAVFISEPDAPPAIDRAALAETYGLTPRECDVAVLLAGGLRPPEIAERLGLTLGAVRQYLNRAYDKTGQRSQALLVALVRGYSGLFS
jgi:DNA-binding CsgD family transcriptional regulator